MTAEVCLEQIIPHGKRLVYVEIGVLRATNLIALANKYPLLKLIGVDSYAEYIDEAHGYSVSKELSLLNKKIAEDRIAKSGHQQRIELVFKDSFEFAETVQDGSVDVVFLDKNFSAEQTELDVITWYPKVSSGGILCGHDAYTEPILRGVKQGLKKFDELDIQIINNEVWTIKR